MNRLCFLSFHGPCLGAAYHGPAWVVILLIALNVVGIAAFNIWRVSRSGNVLDEWAAKNGFQIVKRESRRLFRGPFSGTTARGQTVYFVTVRDQDGLERSGWVRCGGWFVGLLSDKAEVQWVDRADGAFSPDEWLQSVPRRWLWIIVLIIVGLAALFFLLMPKPAPVEI